MKQQIVYVDQGASGGNDGGTSWANAYTTLTEALANLSDSSIIEVAGGTYYPTTTGDISASFDIPSDVIAAGQLRRLE